MEQLPLNLPDDKKAEIIADWRFQYSPKTLIEEVNGQRYVYGSWDHLFGCWQQMPDGKAAREVIPHWMIINERGVWRSSDIDFRMRFPEISVRRSSKWHRQERAAFIAYLSSIPRSIRTLVAPFGQYSWILLDLIWQVPRFAKFLDQEIRVNYGQFVIAVLVLSRASCLPRSARKVLAGQIMSAKRKKLIENLISVPEAGRVLNILERLGATYCKPELYFELAALMNCSRRSQLLSHEKSLKWEVIFGLTRLPEELLVPPIIEIIGDGRESYAELRKLIALLAAAHSAPRRRVADSFKNITTPADADRMVIRWNRRLTEYIAFPEPPLNPHNQLTPLSSPDAMRQEGHMMKNCLSELIAAVIFGGFFYYRWEGPEPATVGIRKTKKYGGRWSFAAAAGVGNKKLPKLTTDYLRSLIDNLQAEKACNGKRQNLFVMSGAKKIKGRPP